jgi:hypothetical protein
VTPPRDGRCAPRFARPGALLAFLLIGGLARAAAAQEEPPPRDVAFEWNPSRTQLYVDVKFRDAIDAEIRRKLSRGLPTSIVLTAAVYRAGGRDPVSTTAQTCKITWHVWDEVYLVEITRPGRIRTTPTSTVAGVLRRCAEAIQLPAGTSDQIPSGVALYLRAKVHVNPVSPELLQKIKSWVSRPTGTGTAAPGDALFSTFTGLFLQRIGDAERELKFTTRSVLPSVRKPKT